MTTKAKPKASPGTPEDPVDHSGAGPEPAVEPEATSLEAKIAKSELFAVNDHVGGGGVYVGISPQNDPEASEAQKRLSSVNPLTIVAPKTGMRVIPKDGDAFTIGEGFGPDATPADWARVTRPDGKPLFA